jgi:NhaP-type Na+/H+ or K+/H+ antiporter
MVPYITAILFFYFIETAIPEGADAVRNEAFWELVIMLCLPSVMIGLVIGEIVVWLSRKCARPDRARQEMKQENGEIRCFWVGFAAGFLSVPITWVIFLTFVTIIKNQKGL